MYLIVLLVSAIVAFLSFSSIFPSTALEIRMGLYPWTTYFSPLCNSPHWGQPENVLEPECSVGRERSGFVYHKSVGGKRKIGTTVFEENKWERCRCGGPQT